MGYFPICITKKRCRRTSNICMNSLDVALRRCGQYTAISWNVSREATFEDCIVWGINSSRIVSTFSSWPINNCKYILQKKKCSSCEYFLFYQIPAEIAWTKPIYVRVEGVFLFLFWIQWLENKTFSSISLLIHQSHVDGYFHESDMKCVDDNGTDRIE